MKKPAASDLMEEIECILDDEDIGWLLDSLKISFAQRKLRRKLRNNSKTD